VTADLAAGRRVQAALELHRFDDAVREAKQLLARFPDDVRTHGWLAQALLSLDREEEALDVVTAGLALDPEEEWFYRLRALGQRQQGQLKEALASLDEALRLDPDLAQAHHLQSLVLSDLRRRSEARAAAERAVALSPETAAYHSALGNLQLDDDPAAAEQHYRAALALDPNSAVTANNLGVALRRQKRDQEAVLAFKSAVRMDPTLEVARRNTHATVRKMMRLGPLLGGGGLFIVKLLAMSATRPEVGMVALLLLAGVGGVATWRHFDSKRRLADLAEKDPQLYDLFRKLERDHGRPKRRSGLEPLTNGLRLFASKFRRRR
jgi:tetratricopeptide (TPR) repeat protein